MSQPVQGNFWDDRYAKRGEAFGTEPNVFLKSQAALFSRGQRVLVPGDGEGRNGVWLAGLGLIVDTVDASATGVANARALAAERGVALNAEVADLVEWTWPVGRYDAVVSIFMHFPMSNGVRARLHAKMLEALKPGGVLVLEAYGEHNLAHIAAGSVGGPKTQDGLFSVEKMRSDFAAADIVSLAEVETEINEGVRHRGHASVVRLIARRRA